MQALHRRRRDCRTLANTPDIACYDEDKPEIRGKAQLNPDSVYSASATAAVAVWYRYQIVTSSSPVPLNPHRVGQRCTLNLSRAETSSHWCGVVVRRGGCQLRCRPRHLTMVQNYVVRRQKP
ncbi:uncharacterized protein TNCV_4403951 [Trichonephila clavipes]|uniref:Uncharacterized protein n=1 Tax=Trichonephila clavipes TaxID=2585209 RepID=A0A8X6S6K2_TRICX|nr:uncharacterized protein TNCV_4403951 [Trichonephila clavipes]